MKFTHQLKFNSVPEWREHYIQYAHLKKYIYALAKKEADLQAGGQLVGDEEGLYAPLLDAARQGGQVRCVVVVCWLCGASCRLAGKRKAHDSIEVDAGQPLRFCMGDAGGDGCSTR